MTIVKRTAAAAAGGAGTPAPAAAPGPAENVAAQPEKGGKRQRKPEAAWVVALRGACVLSARSSAPFRALFLGLHIRTHTQQGWHSSSSSSKCCCCCCCRGSVVVVCGNPRRSRVCVCVGVCVCVYVCATPHRLPWALLLRRGGVDAAGAQSRGKGHVGHGVAVALRPGHRQLSPGARRRVLCRVLGAGAVGAAPGDAGRHLHAHRLLHGLPHRRTHQILGHGVAGVLLHVGVVGGRVPCVFGAGRLRQVRRVLGGDGGGVARVPPPHACAHEGVLPHAGVVLAAHDCRDGD